MGHQTGDGFSHGVQKDGLMVLEHGYWNVNGTAYSPVMLAMVGRGLTTLDLARC